MKKFQYFFYILVAFSIIFFLYYFFNSEEKNNYATGNKDNSKTNHNLNTTSSTKMEVDKIDNNQSNNTYNNIKEDKSIEKNSIQSKSVINDTVTQKVTTNISENKNEKEKKSNFEFILKFKNIEIKDLPEIAYVMLQGNKNSMSSSIGKTIEIKKDTNNQFILKMDNLYYPTFNVRLKHLGYANGVIIPYNETSIIEVSLISGGKISGLIVNSKNENLQDCKVSLFTENESGFGLSYYSETNYYEFSDQSGKFTIEDVLPNRYKIVVKHKKYLLAEKIIQLSDKQILTDINFQLSDGCVLKGILLNSKEEKVAGGTVNLIKVNSNPMINMMGLNEQPENAISDENGEYIFFGLAPSAYKLSSIVKSIGHCYSKKINIKSTDIEKKVNIILTEDFSIKGKIIDKSGKPIEGVVVSAKNSKSERFNFHNDEYVGVSNKDGDFEISLLDNIEYALAINDPKYRFSKNQNVTAKPGIENLVIEVRELLEIRGKIFLPNGEIAKGINLNYITESIKWPMLITNYIENENGFSIRLNLQQFGIVHSKINLIAKNNKYADCVSKVINIKDEDELIENIEMHFVENSPFKFRVKTFDQKVVSKIDYSAQLVGERLNGQFDLLPIAIDEKSEFQISNLIDGEYDFLFKFKNYALIYLKLMKSESNEIREICFTKGSIIKGKIFDSDSRILIDQKIMLKRIDVLSFGLAQHLNFFQYSNENGEFVFENIPIGEYRLKKIDNNKPFSPMDVFNISEGELIKIKEDQEISINIGQQEEASVSISVQVFLDDKIYETGATIILTGQNGTLNGISAMNETDSEGKLSIAKVKPGFYNLIVQTKNSKNLESQSVPIQVELNKENHFEIKLVSEKISGTFTTNDNQKLNGYIGIYKSGTLQKNLSRFEILLVSLYSSEIKDGAFEFKIPGDGPFDVLIAPSSRKYSIVRLLNINKSELLKMNFNIIAAENVLREIKVFDVNNNQINKFDILVYDENGMPTHLDLYNNFNEKVEDGLVYLPVDKNCSIYVSALDFACNKVSVTKENKGIINVTLIKGVRVNVLAPNLDGGTVELCDELKNKFIQPVSMNEMVMSHLGNTSNQIKDGKVILANVPPGKYYIKLVKPKTNLVIWSTLIVVVDQDIEIEIK